MPENLVEKKKVRPDGQEPSFPVKIREDPVVWFKQDDTFNQPFVNCKIRFRTNDLQYPSTAESQIFMVLWKACLEEDLREMSYMADLAGLHFNFDMSLEDL